MNRRNLLTAAAASVVMGAARCYAASIPGPGRGRANFRGEKAQTPAPSSVRICAPEWGLSADPRDSIRVPPTSANGRTGLNFFI
jgi:hypothetical protein